MEKIQARKLTLKTFTRLPKKIDAKLMFTENNSSGSKISHPFHNFSNDPSLSGNLKVKSAWV